MAKPTKIMMFIAIIVLSLSVAFIAIYKIKPCTYCNEKFCFGNCTITYDDDGNPVKINDQDKIGGKTTQNTTQLATTSRADQNYLDDIVFIGDSRTVGYELCIPSIKKENIFAENSLNHEEAMTKKVVNLQEYKKVSIPDAVKVRAPKIMVVNFGVNGIAWMTPEKLVETYEILIDELIKNSPTSIVIIESILPVSMSYEGNVTNEKIDEANALIFKMAKEKKLYYMAANDALKDDKNDLQYGLHQDDGIHFTQSAYDKILDYILTHAIYKK